MSTILSMYLLAIAILPCADDAEWCIFDIEATFGIELHQDADHEHEQQCGDHCSPFCICSCCQITIRLPEKAALTIAIPQGHGYTFSPQIATFPDLTSIHDIWQPPKLI